MTSNRGRYPADYTGYRYDDPAAPLPPITGETCLRAYNEGRAASQNRLTNHIEYPFEYPDYGRAPNPYRGKSKTLDYLWRAGWDSNYPKPGEKWADAASRNSSMHR
jgi:hypothetical protein